MQVSRYAKYVGTMIGPDGYIHRWTAPGKFHPACEKNNAFTNSQVERLSDFKIYAIAVLCFIGCVCAPDKATLLEAENHALQCTTADPHNAIPSILLGCFAPFVALALIWWAFIPSASRLAIELQHARPRFAEVLRRSVRLEDTLALLFSLSPGWDKEFLVPSMALALRMHLILFVGLDSDDEKQKAESRNWPASGQPS